MFRRVPEDFPRGSRTDHEELCGTSERGWGTFGDFPKGGLYSSDHKGLIGATSGLEGISDVFRREGWVLPSAKRSKWFLLVSEGRAGFWGIPRVSRVLLGRRRSKTVTSGFGGKSWGLPERILKSCERFPSGDWVLPGVRG